MRGELDWIVMKTLEKDRNRRYETANGLALDVQRYLADEPVQACPPSASYRLRKFARRHKTVLATTGLILLFIVAVGIGVGWLVRDRAAREREVARDRSAREAALNGEANRAIDEARSLLRDGKWPEAEAVIQRTEAVLLTAGRQPEQLPLGLQELAHDLAMAQRLEAIRSQPRHQEPSDMTAQRREEDGTRPWPQDVFRDEATSAYARAFQDYGIDVTVLPVAEAAERIRGRSIRLELARALDFWSDMGHRRIVANNRGLDWKMLLAVAKLADPDPWRNQLREAVERRDSKGLEALAAAAKTQLLKPGNLFLLGVALINDVGVHQAVDFLHRAQRQYPGDLWINDALGALLSYPAPDEAVRFSTAALAVRPLSPYFTYRVGGALVSPAIFPGSHRPIHESHRAETRFHICLDGTWRIVMLGSSSGSRLLAIIQGQANWTPNMVGAGTGEGRAVQGWRDGTRRLPVTPRPSS